MKIVIDTNVIVSAVFFGGKPRLLLEKVMMRELIACVSEEILREYHETIEELCARYPAKPAAVPITQIASACMLIEPTSDIHVCRDPDDDKFISCAIDSGSLYIVSGDKDLLDLKQYEGVRILTVAAFLDIVLQRS